VPLLLLSRHPRGSRWRSPTFFPRRFDESRLPSYGLPPPPASELTLPVSSYPYPLAAKPRRWIGAAPSRRRPGSDDDDDDDEDDFDDDNDYDFEDEDDFRDDDDSNDEDERSATGEHWDAPEDHQDRQVRYKNDPSRPTRPSEVVTASRRMPMTKEQIVGYVQSEGGAAFRSAVTKHFKNVAKSEDIGNALNEAVEVGTVYTFTVPTAGPPAQVIATPEFIRANFPTR